MPDDCPEVTVDGTSIIVGTARLHISIALLLRVHLNEAIAEVRRKFKVIAKTEV